jgi:hypothetical protein
MFHPNPTTRTLRGGGGDNDDDHEKTTTRKTEQFRSLSTFTKNIPRSLVSSLKRLMRVKVSFR